MPYDETTATRVRPLLSRRKGFEEKQMFGGIGFLLNGNMCCGVWKEFLILRVGPAAYEETLAQEFVQQFDITGRAMKGWVMIEPPGLADPADLKSWVDLAILFAGSLPPKAK
ncbi:MAG: TfoX/Sxy family protein [Planctomycetota bacterium]|nr:TfoX/Sxy family protein [Planctomycetota bacterium]